MQRFLLSLLILLLASLALPACSGGGVGGSGGIGGFGSIFVNGVEWFLDSAEVVLDGIPGSETDLRLGMVVTYKGKLLAGGGSGSATSVSFDDAIQGPVSTLALVSSKSLLLQVLGQDVVLHLGSTVFDDSPPGILGFGFDSVVVGDVLEVSGHLDGDGTIHATWVRKLGIVVLGQTAVELEGEVSGFTGGASFALGSVSIAIDGETDLSELSEALANGLEVEVEGTLTAPAVVLASRIGPIEGLPNVSQLSIEGIVSEFAGLDDFRVAGQLVDASLATFEPANPSFVANGVVIEVDGSVSGGVLKAVAVRLEGAEVEILAELAADSDVDPAAGALVLLGIDVELSPSVFLLDERDGLSGFGLADLVAGDFIEVKGAPSSAGSIVASELRRIDTSDVRLLGLVTGFDEARREVDVFGVSVSVDATTNISGDLGASLSLPELFSTLALGDIVSVVDTVDADNTAIDVADEFELVH